MYLYDEGQNGWNFNIGGGWGPFTCMVGWSEKGFQGVTSVGLNASFGNAIGFNVGWDHDFLSNSDEFSFGVGVGTKNSLSASHSEKITIDASGDISTSNHSSIGLKGNQIAYFSMDTKGTSTFGLGGNAGASLFKKSAKGLNSWGYGGGGGISILGFRFDQNSSFWGWNFSQLNFANSHGYLFNSSNMQHEIRFIGQSVLESVLEKPATGWQYTPYQSSGLYKKRSVTDDWGLFVNYYEAHPNKLEYTENRGFNWPSQDQYYVSSQGINGAFKPFSYRPLKTCYSMEAKDDAIIGKTNDTQYPYTFEYYFNDEQTKISPIFRDGITFKMLGEQALSLIDSTPDELDYSTVRDYKNINLVENNSTGTVAGTRITPLFGIDPYFPDKLNGFVVTDQEGKTYYYTMPLYSLCQFSYTMGVDAVPTSSATELSYRADMGGYAITWLLTAITGPDYVKMVKSEDEGITERLLPHNGDWGYWVTFRYEYGKQVVDNGSGGLSIDQNSTNEEKSAYVWRDPYTGNKISKCETPARYSSTLGIRDITYLKSIETASEVAYFKTSERLDGIGAVDNYTTLPFLLPVDNAGSSGLVDYKTNNYNRLSCWIKKNSVGVIKNKDEIGNDYRNCTKIVLERSRYNIDHIYNEWLAAPEGTPIANYYLKADVEVEGGRIVPQTGNLKIIKNITGFNVNTRQVGDIELGGSHPVETKDIYNFGNLGGTDACNNYGVTAKGKCFFAEKTDNNSKLVFYLAPYRYYGVRACTRISCHDIDCETAVTFAPPNQAKFGDDRIQKVGNVTVSKGYIVTSAGAVNVVNRVSSYQKKLEEICWYSKGTYPYLNSQFDPGTPEGSAYYSGQMLVNPVQFKRATFKYSYELAKNTPNSIAPVGNGRLTLKGVYFEDGQGNSNTFMPPFTFLYQNADQNYDGYDATDKWGFPVSADVDVYSVIGNQPSLGLKWNLSEIRLPSGARINIDYERDFIQSSIGTLYKVRATDECMQSDEFDWNRNVDGEDVLLRGKLFYLRATPIGAPVNNSVRVSIEQVHPEVGMGLITRQEGTGSWYCGNSREPCHGPISTATYLYKVISVLQDGGEYVVTTDHNLPAAGLTELYFVPKAPLYCGDIRVKEIKLNNLGKTTINRFTYPVKGGVLDVPPRNLLPGTFTKSYAQFPLVDGAHGGHGYKRNIAYNPYSSIQGSNSTGNSSVIYPYVTVATLNNSGNTVAGSTKYSFYTSDDMLTVGERTDVPVVEEINLNGTYSGVEGSVPVKRIVNRSGIIGQVKKVEYLNNAGLVVKSAENVYCFSEDLNTYAGVLDGQMTNKLSEDKPIGLLRERSLRVNTNGVVEKVADC